MLQIDSSKWSSLEIQPREIHLRLKARILPAGLLEQVKTWFEQDGYSSWVMKPFLHMTVEQPDDPRWKKHLLDLLSVLIFLLLVPQDEPLVQLWFQLDWQAINRVCAPCYRNHSAGQRAWAPAQMIALLLLFVLLPHQSETGLLKQVAHVPLYRWFCGFGLFTNLPDHSSLHTFRKRLGPERFEALLTHVVLQCQQAGLLGNQLTYFDMTAVAASAHRFNAYERAVLLTQALIYYLERLPDHPDEDLSDSLRLLLAEVALEAQDNEHLRQTSDGAARVLRSLKRWTATQGQPLWQKGIERAVAQLLAEGAPPPRPSSAAGPEWKSWLKGVANQLKAYLPHARGDLDARVGWTSDITLRCGYWMGFLVDSLHHVITAVRFMPLNQMQHGQMITALDQHRHRLGNYPQGVAADSAQDYEHVHQALDQRHIQGQIASRAHQGRGGGFGPAHFRYTATGQLICPQGTVLEAGRPHKNGLVPHRARDCCTCPLKAECLPAGQQPNGPRVVHLVPAAHQRWLQNRENTKTEAYKQAQRKRFASEGLFGLAERLHQAKKAPYRSQPMNWIAALLTVTAMNLAVLNRHAKRSNV
jgi:transposase